MTVETQVALVVGLGNDSGTVFSYSPVVIYQASDMEVTHTSITGVDTVLTEGVGPTNYSISPATFALKGSTGSVTYPADEVTPMATGEKITMKKKLTLEQLTDIQNQGGYQPEVLETQLDKLAGHDIQQQEEINRSVTLPISVTGVSTVLPIPVASTTLGWNATADAIVNGSAFAALPVPITEGGTGSITALAAMTALGKSFPDGVTTAPGIAFDSDPDCGLRRVSSNVIAAVAGGVDVITLASVTSAVNTLLCRGSVTAKAPRFSVTGPDTDIGMILSTKGSGVYNFHTENVGAEQFRIAHTASAVNFIQVTGGAAVNAPILSVLGDDATINFIIRPKGDDGSVFFQNDSAENIFQITSVASAARMVQAVAATSSGTPGFTTTGGDLNLAPATSIVRVMGTAVLGTRKTGWAAATGTPTRTTFATSTVTTEELAERVAALIDDLLAHGLIGA